MNDHELQAGALTGLQQALQLPQHVSYWPPAPLWWLIALVATALSIWLIFFLCRKMGIHLLGRAKNKSTESLAQITHRHLQQHFTQWQTDNITSVYLAQANVLLKRYVLSCNSAQDQISTSELPTIWHGEQWVNWMQQAAPTKLSPTTMRGLANDCYRCEATMPSVPIVDIHQQLQQWITDYSEHQHA